ncbi:MAG TPA: DUF4142 domain-containing protein [Stenotrophomonas sp.]|nr:DUF4142 domain-containing protein [Stenotrophomonas sp.]
MRRTCLPLPLILLCVLLMTPHAGHAAQAEPNDPGQARDRYVAPKVRQLGQDLPGFAQASAEERDGLGLLRVIDQYQADLSRLALDRGLDPEVQAWAAQSLRTHATREGRPDRWLPDIGQPRAQAWMRRAQQELAALRAAAPASVSSAYLQAMSQSLAEALQLIEDELLPAASSPDVHAYLNGLRKPLAAELATARRLQSRGDRTAGA